MRKFVCSLVSAVLLLGLLAACGGTSSQGNTAGNGGTTPAGGGDRQKIVFWHDNSGDEALVYEAAVEAYNAAQDKYEVEVLSVTDAQKLVVAMSGNESPDVIKKSNASTIPYMLNGMLENLQPYVEGDNGVDLSIYTQQAIDANLSADGDIYALPLTAYTIQLFYNVDMLKDLGYDAPPATWEDMYKIAIEGTKLADDGSFEVLGYPIMPYAAARQELVYGWGGHWWDPVDRTTLTPQAEGNLKSLQLNMAYREMYGTKAVDELIIEANKNRYTAQDAFFTGNQLFRIDGSWLPAMMEAQGSTVNWAVTLLPGTEANPDLEGVSRFETDSVAIPVSAPNKDGAWDFAKWLTSEDGARIICLGNGNLPALESLYEDPDFAEKPGFGLFIAANRLNKGIHYPLLAEFAEYVNMVQAQLEEAYAGNATPEEALAELAKISANIK